MMIDRRQFFSKVVTFAAFFAGASFAMVRDDRAFAYLRHMAETVMDEENVGYATISATCCCLRGEVDSYDKTLLTDMSAVRMGVAVLNLEKTGFSRDEIDAALFRLQSDVEARYLMETGKNSGGLLA